MVECPGYTSSVAYPSDVRDSSGPRLERLVKDAFDALKCFLNGDVVTDVALDEIDLRPYVAQIVAVPGREIIEDANSMPGVE